MTSNAIRPGDEHMKHPFVDLIDLKIDTMASGASVCSLIIDPEKHLNPHGIADGSIFFALADTGMGAALASVLSENEICMTIEIKINYFKAARQGKLHSETELIHRGKTLANLQSRLFCGEKLVAQANGSFAILEGRAEG